MKKLLGIVVLGLLLSGNAYADTIYNGTFIDAHRQVGKLITDETVSKIINKNDVDSFRRDVYKAIRKIHITRFPYNAFLYPDIT